MGFLQYLGEIIGEQILKVIWMVFVQGPLNLIAVVQEVFQYLTVGVIFDVLFNGKRNFGIENIPASFWGFCIIAVFLSVLIFIVQYLTYTFNEDLDLKTKIVKSLKSTGLGIVFTFFIPVGFYGVVILIEFLQTAIQLNFGLKNTNLAKLLYKMGDPNWTGDLNGVPDDYKAPDGLYKNFAGYAIVLVLTWFILYTLIMLCASVVQKAIELFLLFLIGPMVAAWMVNDHGVRMRQWKDMVMAKALVSIGSILSYVIMINFMMMFYSRALGEWSFFSKLFIYAVVGLGVSQFALVAPQIVASFTGGEGMSHEEGRNALLSASHGKGILGAGMKALGWAAGGAGMMALLRKGKGQNSGGGAARSGMDNLSKAKSMAENLKQSRSSGGDNAGEARMGGIPGMLGKAARTASATASGIGAVFTRKGWSTMGSNIKNVAGGVAGGIAGIAGANTIHRFFKKRDGQETTYFDNLTLKKRKIDSKQERINLRATKIKEKIESFSNLAPLINNLKNSKNETIRNKILKKEKSYNKLPTKKEKLLKKAERLSNSVAKVVERQKTLNKKINQRKDKNEAKIAKKQLKNSIN